MLSVENTYSNKSGTFPNAVAINSTGPATTDGTEYIAAGINNWQFGWSQFVLNYAGLTPDEVVESGSASQIFEAFQKSFGILPGTVMQWHLNDTPANFGVRAFELNGQGVLRASYPELDANTYVGDGNNAAVAAAGGGYYRADDAAGTTPNIAGVYLILPDTRGYVPRGLDVAASVDPDGAGRYIGDNQLDAFQGHKQEFEAGITATANVVGDGCSGPTLNGYEWSGATNSTKNRALTGGYHTDGVNGTPRTSSETRMTNFATQFIIVY